MNQFCINASHQFRRTYDEAQAMDETDSARRKEMKQED
jgi:hypothetical protein